MSDEPCRYTVMRCVLFEERYHEPRVLTPHYSRHAGTKTIYRRRLFYAAVEDAIVTIRCQHYYTRACRRAKSAIMPCLREFR